MKLKFLIAMLLLVAGNGAAFAAGPEATIKKLATTIENKDGRGFMECVDFVAMVDAEPAAYDSDALYMGSSGNDVRYLEDRIASGVMARWCKETRKPGCAWTVDGLKKPLIKKISPVSAVVAVDNPEDIRTWIALYQGTAGWKVVGVSKTEREAVTFASEDFQKKREDYRRRRIAAEKAVEKRAADDKVAAERRREDENAKIRQRAAKDNAILKSIKLSNVTVKLRSNVGHDGKQKDFLITGTVVNQYSEDIAKIIWRLEFTDDSGAVIAYSNIKDLDLGDDTLRRGVAYERKWRQDLRGAQLQNAADLFAKGKCKATLRPYYLSVGDTRVQADRREVW